VVLFVVEVVLFVVSGATAHNNKHPGTLSNIFWGLFLVGFVFLILLAIATVVQSRRSRAR
jgi:tetrahydromethanopterin S-methyltransferase subunit B